METTRYPRSAIWQYFKDPWWEFFKYFCPLWAFTNCDWSAPVMFLTILAFSSPNLENVAIVSRDSLSLRTSLIENLSLVRTVSAIDRSPTGREITLMKASPMVINLLGDLRMESNCDSYFTNPLENIFQ